MQSAHFQKDPVLNVTQIQWDLFENEHTCGGIFLSKPTH